uniref:hypothetical protein n=1 Tax=Bacillus velezensis TaxID=492670 RepID=UPI0020C02BC6
NITWTHWYYYAVLSKNQGDLTIANIKDVIERADSSNYTDIPGGGIISYGKGQITEPSDASSEKTFTAIQTSTDPNSTNIFQMDQKIYLFT